MNWQSKSFPSSFQISFVIPPESIPGRLGILLTLQLCLINMFIFITSKSPKTHSLTSISTWLMFCIFYVAFALNQFGCILLIKYLQYPKVDGDFQINAKKIDFFSLIVSVITFFIFNASFWYFSLFVEWNFSWPLILCLFWCNCGCNYIQWHCWVQLKQMFTKY